MRRETENQRGWRKAREFNGVLFAFIVVGQLSMMLAWPVDYILRNVFDVHNAPAALIVGFVAAIIILRRLSQ